MNTSLKNNSAAFGWVGIVAAVAYIVMWLACYQADSSWTWGVDAISDFGISDSDAAEFFCYGTVISGVLLAIYGVGKAQSSNVEGYCISGVLSAFTGICLIVLGILTVGADNGDIRYFFAAFASIMFLVAIIANAVQQYRDGMTFPVGISMILCFVATMCMIAFDNAEYVVCCLVIGILWLIVDGIFMIALCPKGGKQ